MLKRMARRGCLVLLLILIVACRPAAPEADLPAPPPLPDDALLSYWVGEGDPLAVSESVAFYADGAVTYHDHLGGRQGSQFVGALGLDHFLKALEAAGFAQLEPAYRAAKRGDPPHYAAIARRAGDEVKTVQWETSAVPAVLREIGAELAQFLAVVRASAR